MRRKALAVSLTLALAIALGMIASPLLNAQQQPPPIKRTELLRTDLPGVTGKEAVVFIAEVQPGVASGKHFHHGSELIYVIQGSYILEIRGSSPLRLKAGDSRHAPPGEVHEVKNDGSSPIKVLVFLIVDKGKPLAESVK